MANEQISQWLQSQGAVMDGALAGIVSLSPGEDGVSVDIGWPQQAASLSGFQLVSSRVSDSQAPCIKPVNTESSNEYAAIVGCPVTTSEDGTAVTAFLVKGKTPDIGESALNKLREAIPSLEETLSRLTPDTLLESPMRVQANKEAAAQLLVQGKVERLGKLTRLLATALSTNRFTEAALTLTTELALELNCERVSLGMRRGHRTRLEAVSHTARINRSRPAAQAAVAAMDEALDQHSAIFFPPLETDSQILSTLKHEALSNLERQDHLCTIPLLHENEAVGALLLERKADSGFTESDQEMFDHIASFLAPVLQMKYRIGQPWYKRLRLGLSNLRTALGRKEGLLWTMAGSAVLAAVVFLAIVPLPDNISGSARVEGQVQRLLSAPQTGYIEEVHVRPGDTVVAGEILLELEDKELTLSLDQTSSELRQFESEYGKALATRDRTEIAVTQAKMSEAKAQLELVEQQLSRTSLRAPFDGIVLEGDLTQSLGAPVEKGEQLMVLAPDMNVRLSVHVEESEIRDIKLGQQGKVAFSANPGKQYDIVVSRVTPVASVHEGKNGFTVEAALQDTQGDDIRPGFQGLAKLSLEPAPWLPRQLAHAGDWLQFQFWRWIGEL